MLVAAVRVGPPSFHLSGGDRNAAAAASTKALLAIERKSVCVCERELW